MVKETDASDVISHLPVTFADTGSLQTHSKGCRISWAGFQFCFQAKKTLAALVLLSLSHTVRIPQKEIRF